MKSKRLLLTLLLALLVPWAAQAQEVVQKLTNYELSTDVTTFNSIVSTGTQLTFTSNDDGYAAINFPFNFAYGESNFTTQQKIACSSNGFIHLGSASLSGSTPSYSSTNRVITPLPQFDGHMARYSDAGTYWEYDETAQTLTIEYHKLGAYTAESNTYGIYSYQIVLHKNGDIEFIYDEVDHQAATSRTMATYLTDGANSDRLFVTGAWAEPEKATTYAARPFTPVPEHGLRYTFTRPVKPYPEPENVRPGTVTDETAEILWNAPESTNTISGYTYNYKKHDDEFWSSEGSTTSTSANLDELDENTLYDFRVKAWYNNNSGESEYATTTFTTACAAISALDFDKGDLDSYTGTTSGSTNNLPDCWNYINTTTYSSYKGYPIIYNSSNNANSTPNSLRFYSSYASWSNYDPQPQYAILPPMDDLAGMQVTLQAKGYNTSSTFKIGTMSNPMDASTFHMITEQTGLTTSYQEFEYMVPSTCTDSYLVIMIDAANSSRSTNCVYIDDIVIATPPSCSKPNGLDVTASGLNAIFTWESIESQWQVAYSTVATANPDDNIVATVDTKTYTSPDLTVDNDYYFWVRSYCSGSEQSDWAGPKPVHIGYCVPAPTSIDGSGISNVTFGKLPNTVNDNLSMTASPYYYDHSSQAGAAWLGNSVEIKITYATNYNYYTWVWVDWDNDLAFSDDEQVYASSSTISSGILTITFPVPATQALGNYRMRIQGADDSSKENPCYTGTYSYLVDYTLSVIEAPSCLPPTNLNLSRNNDQIRATWEGTADTYNIDINGTVTENVTNPYIFTAELSTTYTVKVQANCTGGETSDWSNSKSITTPDCWDGHVIEYTLSDSYGDGWDGNPISAILVYEGCGNLVETLTVPNGSYSLSGTLALCGDYYEFVWQAGQYPGECSFTFTEGGTTIFTKPSNATDGMVLYTIGTLSCPAPSDLTAGTAEARSVALTWNENGEATAWQICLNGDEENLIEVVENFTINEGVVSYTLNGLTPDTDYTIKVRANCGEEQSCWSNDDSFSTIVACPVPTNLDVAEEKIEEEKAVLTWVAGGEETAWNIQLATYDDANETWSEYEVIEENFNKTTYPIEGLTAGTTYRVQVQAVCGGEFNDMSEWSDYFEFTTVATCVAPTNLAVTPDSETAFGATVTWEGTNDSYILEYSKAITPDVEFDETYDFENGTQGWTTIDADGHGDAWSRYNSTSDAHNSSYSMKATYNYSYAHQDYLVSPQIPLGGTFSFYLKKSGSYTDTFRVYLSQTGNTDASDFSIELTDGDVLPGTSYGDTPYTYDLSNYSGMGYVAIVYTAAANQGWLYVDDINITASIEGEYGAWQTVENATSPYPFDELDPESMYKVRVKGVCGSSQSQYSNVVKFTTLDACPAPTNFTLGEVTGNSAAFSWTQPTNGVEITEWVVKYRKSGETEWQTLTPNPTTPSATIENLDANAGYEVVIAPACNEEKTLEDEFDTPCTVNVITYGSPYTYDFEDITEWSCWNNISGNSNRTSVSGNNVIRFAGINNVTNTNIVALPEFDHEISELMIVFWTRPEGYTYTSCGTFEVGYMTDLANTESFVSVLDEAYSYDDWTSNTFAKKTAVFTDAPAGAHIAFRHNAGAYNYYWYVDDVMVGLPQNFSKEIAGYGAGYEEDKANWYLIASPIGDINPTEVTNMTEGNFDLYYFDQAQNYNEWRNYEGTNGGYDLNNGKGYLYANQENTTITFTGIANHANATVNLVKNTSAVWSGWNLVGNPFGVPAYINRDFYRINEETGAEIIQSSGAINVMEGVFVVTDEDNVEMTFSTTEPVSNGQGSLALNLSNNSNVIDRATVRFNDERTLPKFQLHENSTKVYIPMDGKDYAVVSAGEVGEMPVSFKAEKNGSYTLSFTSQEVSFSYLHLIDNMTGNDVDLLANPSYSFDALTTDYESRFRLVFATGSSIDGDSFGFINAMGNLCIFGIDGTATVQVVDVTGRMLSSETFSGSYERKLNVAPGVYMIRLINGNDVKVQKMIVR